MTHDLLLGSTRLWWMRGHGLARHDDVQVALRKRPPVLHSVEHVEEIEFAPAVHMAYVQPRGERRRDMEPDERSEVMQYLQRMARHVRSWFDAEVTS